MSSEVHLAIAGLAIRVCSRVLRMDPIRSKKYALSTATFVVRVCSNAWLPVAFLGIQVALLTGSSAGATVYARQLSDWSKGTLETVKSMPGRANYAFTVVAQRTLSEPQPDDAPRKVDEDALAVVRKHAAHAHARERVVAQQQQQEAVIQYDA